MQVIAHAVVEARVSARTCESEESLCTRDRGEQQSGLLTGQIFGRDQEAGDKEFCGCDGDIRAVGCRQVRGGMRVGAPACLV